MQEDNLERRLEKKLAKMHEREFCILVGRGAVGIYLALKALGYDNGKVVLPSILCLTPANIIIYAGLKPVYCDVNFSDFNLDIQSLEEILKNEEDVRAVILPHLYGQPTDIDTVTNLVQKYNVPLIEDAAQALGGSYKGKPLGSFGGFSVLSFGHTKILDVGGGGAILFNDKKYLKIIKGYLDGLPTRAKNYLALSEKYFKTYYALASLVRKDSSLSSLYYTFPYIFKDLYLFRDIESCLVEKIGKRLKSLKDVVYKRNENGEYYSRVLQHEKIIHPDYRWKGVYWRYSFLIKEKNQVKIAEEVRQHDVDISNWYPPIHLFYELTPSKLKNAEHLGRHIFNLWVEPKYSKKDIKKNADVVLSVLDKYG